MLSDFDVVEVGEEIETMYGPVFGLRFRRANIWGDVSVKTADSLCQSYTIRLQRNENAVPHAWPSEFGLAPLFRALTSATPDRRYFEKENAFPPGYP